MAAKKYVVVMGVAGCGKTEIGRQLAQKLSVPFIEGDQFHPEANVEKMRNGVPLTDDDRAGWLQILVQQLQQHEEGAVLACSALKKRYRDLFRVQAGAPHFVFLQINEDLAKQRVAERCGHFYPPSLVTSQFQTLETPVGEPDVCTLGADQLIEQIVHQAASWLSQKELQIVEGNEA